MSTDLGDLVFRLTPVLSMDRGESSPVRLLRSPLSEALDKHEVRARVFLGEHHVRTVG
jgi:hypothetical protein